MKIGIFPNMGKEALYTFWGKLISILQAKHIEYYVAEYAREIGRASCRERV